MSTAQEAYLAALLSRTGLLDSDRIQEVLADRTPEGGLVEAAVRIGGLRESEFLAKIAPLVGMRFVSLAQLEPNPEAVARLPARCVFQYGVVPLGHEDGELTVVTSDPFDTGMADGLRLAVGGPIKLCLGTRDEISKAARKYYGVGAEVVEKMMADGRFDADADADLNKADLSEMGQEASVVRFVNQIIAEADRQGATDIHFEPMENELRIRYRIDGLLHKVDVPAQLNRLKAAITSRLKVMANLDIAEKRMPMDGRIGIRVNGQDVDIRVSTMPTVYGESVSLRLLQKSENFVRLGELGMHEDDQALIEKIIHRPNGIVLVTGPTGSGKSTSLYAFLHEINRMDVRILTAEDPIEYEMPGVNQVAVKSDIGLSFARILRAFLRQDPDIVMVGEIRDAETAEIAINASLTGHLVLSTLHTNDAAGAFVRLVDMGVEPFLVASAVAAVMAQRLVRRLCVSCRKPEPFDEERFGRIDLPPKIRDIREVFVPVGCDQCSQTGYRGRGGIFELLHVTEELESMIIARHSSSDIRQKAIEAGMRTLRDDGWRKILDGVTTVEEVLRVTEEND